MGVVKVGFLVIKATTLQMKKVDTEIDFIDALRPLLKTYAYNICRLFQCPRCE